MNPRDELVEFLETFYADSAHPWGDQPDPVVVDHVEELLPGTVLDLGAGDGRNAVFLAQHGFDVVAVDFLQTAIAELQRSASRAGVEIETHIADIAEFPLEKTYENVVCAFTLHFLDPADATDLIARVKERTTPGGVHLVSLFTNDGPLYKPSAKGFWVEPGRLPALYGDWEILHAESRVVETASKDEAGKPIRQPTDEIVARRPPLASTP